MKESDLYGPMRMWLHRYIVDNYPGWSVTTLDSHNTRLDRALLSQGIRHDIANGIDIQIDILGIARKRESVKLFFIEAKQTALTLRDLGQLWAYCKLTDPDEAFLLTSSSLGTLNKIMNIFNREDMLDFGNGRHIKKMRIAHWDTATNAPDMSTMFPKL